MKTVASVFRAGEERFLIKLRCVEMKYMLFLCSAVMEYILETYVKRVKCKLTSLALLTFQVTII
jgi:hypothetical protein